MLQTILSHIQTALLLEKRLSATSVLTCSMLPLIPTVQSALNDSAARALNIHTILRKLWALQLRRQRSRSSR
jgi:hypothetical protein